MPKCTRPIMLMLVVLILMVPTASALRLPMYGEEKEVTLTNDIYENQELKYKIYIPQGWVYKKMGNNFIALSPGRTLPLFTIYSIPVEIIDSEEEVIEKEEEAIEPTSETTIAGQTAPAIEVIKENVYKKAYYVIGQNDIFEITIFGNYPKMESEDQIFQEILDSFTLLP